MLQGGKLPNRPLQSDVTLAPAVLFRPRRQQGDTSILRRGLVRAREHDRSGGKTHADPATRQSARIARFAGNLEAPGVSLADVARLDVAAIPALCLALCLAAPRVRAEDRAAGDDFEAAIRNTREVAHQVIVRLPEPGVAVLEVTRTFEPRSAAAPVCLGRNFDLPGEAVVTSLAVRTDGHWRGARLRRSRPKPGRAAGRGEPKPWAGLEWLSGSQVEIETPVFRSAGRFDVRYTIWTQGASTPTGHLWSYCPDYGDTDGIAPTILPAAGTMIEVRPGSDTPDCRDIVSQEPPPTKVSVRYGAYRLGPGAWWWRLEVRAPASLVPTPAPPEPGPVVFVLDASRSQKHRGGLGAQLAIVEAYLTHAPAAEVELVRVSRSAERVFGRFVAAADFSRALPAELARGPLGNGSFLDRGAALAADLLRGAGRPGRIVLFTDGELRSGFEQGALVATLRRAPRGTIVHLIYPGSWGTGEIDHHPPDGLSEVVSAFGGASYDVSVGGKPAPDRGWLTANLGRLVWPDRIESVHLLDARSRERDEWPDDALSPFTSENEVEAGGEHVWSGQSEKPPPGRLSLVGWVWANKLDLPLRPDPVFERRLPRLATSQGELVSCHPSERHRKVALADGFLAPGLVFWVSGTGEMEEVGQGGSGGDCEEGATLGGRGTATPRPRQALAPELLTSMQTCGLVPDPAGGLRVEVETQGNEILDVAVAGGDAEPRRCAEEGLWALPLPDDFNHDYWKRERYLLAFSYSPSARPPAPGAVGR